MARPCNTVDNENRKFVDSPTRTDQSAVEVYVGGKDANANQETITLVDTSSTTILYLGFALPGSSTSDPVWRIQKVDLTTTQIEILFADSNQEFDNVWDDRASLTYG